MSKTEDDLEIEARLRGHLRQFMAEADKNYEGMADLLDVNVSTVQRYLTGLRGFGAGMAYTIMKRCRISPWRLLQEDAPEQYDDAHWTPPPRGRKKTKRR